MPLNQIPLFSVYSKLGIYELLGIEFYSSGMTRALISFYQLNFAQAYMHNPLVFAFMFSLIAIFILDIYRYFWKNNTNEILNKKNKVN